MSETRALNSPAPCACCTTLRAYIAAHLDPEGLLSGEDDPREVVASLDAAFRDEGGSGISVEEMADYLMHQ